MPYALPSSSSSSTATATLSPPSRPTHRRTRSAFSEESTGPGAFGSLGSLPRRRSSNTSSNSKKPLFHLEDEDSPEENVVVDDLPTISTGPLTPSYASTNSLRLSIDSGRFSPSVNPPSYISIPKHKPSSSLTNAVPFPTSSPVTDRPHSPFIPPSPPHTSSLPRTPSTPIILSNGKPLKSSLKSSSSSPNVAGDFTSNQRRHFRAQSAPNTPKVHFAEKDAGLEMVKVFTKGGKPASLSKPSGEETETETEAESYPFPLFSPSSQGMFSSSPLATAGSSGARPSQQLLHEIDTSTAVTSSIPNPCPSPLANVFLETVTLPRTRPPTLRGTVIVRNLAFEKHVAVRFTLDDWQTTSEVLCKHVVSLPGLPPPFPRQQKSVRTVGDVAASLASGEESKEEDGPSWDRFSFTIRLEDYESKLADRTIYLVARYVSIAGEFWDNNDAKNYRIGFRRSAISPLSTPRMQPVSTIANTLFSNSDTAGSAVVSQQRSFSAPSSLKVTPVTGAASPVVSRATVNGTEARRGVSISAVKQAEESESEVEKAPIEKDSEGSEQKSPSLALPASIIRRHSSPPSNSPETRSPHLPLAPPSFFNTAPSTMKSPTTQRYISRRLSLSNYVAPSASPVEEKKDGESSKEGALVTPPTTPPRDGRLKELPEPSRESGEVSPGMLSPLVMIGGMPASNVSAPLPSSPSSFASSARLNSPPPRVTSPPVIRTSDLSATKPDTDDVPSSAMPFSPSSRARFGMSGLGSQFGNLSQLASPPVSRQGSENSTPSTSGRNSPLRKRSPPPSTAASIGRKGSPIRVKIPTPESSFADEVRRLSPPSPEESESQVTTPTPMSPGPVQVPGQGNKVDTSDSSYAAFVRQWCFAQSAPPTPGVQLGTEGSPNGSSPPSMVSPSSVSLKSTSGSQVSPSSLHGYPSASAIASHVGPKRQQAWPVEHLGGSSGYGFPGFGFGGVQKGQGVVGGELYSALDSVADAASAVPGYARGIIV
ncbi:hypothetical protein BC835DRAFT_1010220 [Cytidiella melzeri]|nr:hypothetical protein BC835DRAFT_1010220 [Cytidiella melzeri]